MYFDLPKSHERAKKATNSFGMTEERFLEIMNNIQEHFGSPPIFTAETLDFILSNQWVTSETKTPEALESKLVQKMKETRVINSLIKELCQTIETIDTEKKHEVTRQITNDSVLRDIRNGESTVADEKTLEHLVQLLRHHNNKT